MHRQIEAERGCRVHEAIGLGATWSQVAAALAVTPDQARALLRGWSDGQNRLHCQDVEHAVDRPLGLRPERYGAVLALCELGDHETAITPQP
ncbi:hypothetical protein ACFW2D_17880 [Streptomyces sp. NPDC058914]|uniref:hypothetical protein n=1 Tax=Streptomyces sp. NPDC058914 TaxID=3346671 RepID=UPI00367A0511